MELEGSFIMKNIATSKVEKRPISVIDKCFLALFVSGIFLIVSFIAAYICLGFDISIFGNPVLTCHTLLVGGLIVQLGVLICCAVIALIHK